MPAVGRRRVNNTHLPAGVRPIGDRLFWQATAGREREELLKAGRSTSAPLGLIVMVRGRIELTKEQRLKWAEVSGFRDSKESTGTVAELTLLWAGKGILTQPNGLPRAESTIGQYRKDLEAIDAKFGACKYGKTAHEASRGEAIGTVDVQAWVAGSPTKALANRRFACLDNVFQHAIRNGKTTYNPCADAVKNASNAREREPLPWEVECLRTLAGPLMGLQMDYEGVTGWRISDIQRLQRLQLTADGIKVRQKKRGKRQLWEWTPELRRIVADAVTLPGATPFPASPVFPSRRGLQQSYKSFDSNWQALKRKANALLAECDIPLRILDLHFHDLRSKAHDDAEDAGQEGHEFLGNTKAVASRHYKRRAQKIRALK